MNGGPPLTALLFWLLLYCVVGLLVMLPVRLYGIALPHDRGHCYDCSPKCSQHGYRQCKVCRIKVVTCRAGVIGRMPLQIKEWLGCIGIWPVFVVWVALLAVFGLACAVGRLL